MTAVKVMIVDDHDLARRGLRAALEIEGDYGDATTAPGKARTARPDVVLMDVRMPVMDGIQACGLPRESLPEPETRVVMLTSYSDEEAVVASIMAGASGYLLKNTPRAGLLHAMRRAAAWKLRGGVTEVPGGVQRRPARFPASYTK